MIPASIQFRWNDVSLSFKREQATKWCKSRTSLEIHEILQLILIRSAVMCLGFQMCIWGGGGGGYPNTKREIKFTFKKSSKSRNQLFSRSKRNNERESTNILQNTNVLLPNQSPQQSKFVWQNYIPRNSPNHMKVRATDKERVSVKISFC